MVRALITPLQTPGSDAITWSAMIMDETGAMIARSAGFTSYTAAYSDSLRLLRRYNPAAEQDNCRGP